MQKQGNKTNNLNNASEGEQRSEKTMAANFGELVLLIGDHHIPSRSLSIPEPFQRCVSFSVLLAFAASAASRSFQSPEF